MTTLDLVLIGFIVMVVVFSAIGVYKAMREED
jgi:hypothetical protein